MNLHFFDILIFICFAGFVVFFGIFKSRHEQTGEEFFSAGRKLIWPIIGFSLIAANISTEQFIGMNGQATGGAGLAVAAYDWIAAICLVLTAIFFIPRLLRSGIYTLPEYLEYRYNSATRLMMSVYMIIIYVTVITAAILYSGGLALSTIFGLNLNLCILAIGIIAAVYATSGGLKAVAWADLIQGPALILGGFLVVYFSFKAVGGPTAFFESNREKMHTVLPADNPSLPWTALLAGIWVPNLYYWGFNQYIVQKTLAAKSLKEAQLGIILAAAIQVVLPVIIVVPGIIAWQLYSDQLTDNPDRAFGLLVRNLVPIGIRGFVFAALAGAVVSSLASVLNSSSTIFTMDIFKRYLKKDATSREILKMGRFATVAATFIGCCIAPVLSNPRFQGVFAFMVDFQGYVAPGVLAAFLFGFVYKRALSEAGLTAFILNIPVYGCLHLFSKISFLNKWAITFFVIIIGMWIVSLIKPLKEPVSMPVNKDIELRCDNLVYWLGGSIVFAVIVLYIIFW